MSKVVPLYTRFTLPEKQLLLKLVKDHTDVLCMKNSGPYSRKLKAAAWETIHRDFNEASPAGWLRSIESIHKFFDISTRKVFDETATYPAHGDDEGAESSDSDGLVTEGVESSKRVDVKGCQKSAPLVAADLNDMDISNNDSMSVGLGELAPTAPISESNMVIGAKTGTKNKRVTGYILFSQEARQGIPDMDPNSISGEFSRLIGNDWQSLPVAEKIVWEERAMHMNMQLEDEPPLEEVASCSSPALSTPLTVLSDQAMLPIQAEPPNSPEDLEISQSSITINLDNSDIPYPIRENELRLEEARLSLQIMQAELEKSTKEHNFNMERMQIEMKIKHQQLDNLQTDKQLLKVRLENMILENDIKSFQLGQLGGSRVTVDGNVVPVQSNLSNALLLD